MKYGIKIDHISFIDEHGVLTDPLALFVNDPAALVHMYELMVITRALDQKGINMSKVRQVGTYASTLGEEAVDVGIGCAILDAPGTVFAPYYRNHGTLIALKGEMAFLSTLLFWGGDERGNQISDADSLLPFAVPIGTQFPIATGLAKGRRLLKKAGAIVVTGGDGSTSKGDFNSSLNEAATKKLPIVFVIKNNQWAISMPLSEQTATNPLAMRASGYAMQAKVVDGNDVLAVRHAVSLGIAHANAGKGPMLIEAKTYRLADHTTVDSAKDYRGDDEVEAARTREPVARMRKFLVNSGHWEAKQEDALIKRVTDTANNIQKLYLETPPQASSDMLNYLFEQIPDVSSCREQLAEITRKGK